MKQYLELMQDILDNGVESDDRTGTGTLSVFGRQMRFDLSKGFPLLTTKKLHFKSIAIELLWFLRGDTNTKWLNENGVTIWDNWLKPFKPYTGNVITIKRVTKKYEPHHEELTSKPLSKKLNKMESMLRGSWLKMIDRCYNKDAHNYRFYGGVGISVCKRWQEFENYLNDVQKLHNWNYKRLFWNDFELDKDYYDMKQYCPEGCIWMSKEHNISSDYFEVTNKNGDVYLFPSISEASEFTGISRSSIHRFLKQGHGENKIYKGRNRRSGVKDWVFRYSDNGDYFKRYKLSPDNDLGPIYGKQWRNWEVSEIISIRNKTKFNELVSKGYKFKCIKHLDMNTKVTVMSKTHDQIANIIKSIKEDPHSRRHIVSAWNVGELEEMALFPCHYTFQFYVRNGKLSCMYTMRSNDFFIGNPYNIASYALLTHMIAHVCGLDVGELIFSGGDVHLYKNHIEQAKLQLTRDPLPLPTLKFARDVKDIDDFKFEDFIIEGYEAHPHIKGEVAV